MGFRRGECGVLALLLVAGLVSEASSSSPAAAHAATWCDGASTAAQAQVQWSQPLEAPGRTVLGQHDVYSCSVLPVPATAGGAVTRTRLLQQSGPPAPSRPQLRQALLLDCDAGLWQLAGVQDTEAACIASTSLLRAACNQWLVTVPTADQVQGEACAPPNTAFAAPGSLKGRVLVLQAHWQLPEALVDTAVALPSLQLSLGASTPAPASADGFSSGSSSSSSKAPVLLGTFVGSGIYPPSELSGGLQAFKLPAAQPTDTTATASLACSKRCTYVPLGKLNPKPVTVVGYSFNTFDRAVNVSFEIRRGKWGRSAGRVHVASSASAAAGVQQLQQPFQLHAGDSVRWSCSYDMSSVAPDSSGLTGGYSSAPSAQQEQCTVTLHYWPRLEAMRGCSTALEGDVLLGENMCSSEAEDLIRIKAAEDRQFPMRRMYQEHSFPRAAWMGGWKATHIILQMAGVWACLWGFQTLLSKCKALGPIHRRFVSLAAGQQRNVSLYLTHLLLDTICLAYVFQPMIELWLGLTETVAEVRPGVWGFTYIVACYALELTWRRSIDTMLAIHHIGTITIILMYAGEFTASTYRVANNIIVLAAFALMEQPTYVALLLKRMMPGHSKHVVRAAHIGYISWFLLKGASVLLAASMFVEDWHLMPVWIRWNFLATWVVAALVQGWSGFIQRGIYKHILRVHNRSKWEHKQELLKRQAAQALTLHARPCSSSEEEEEEATGGGSSGSGPSRTSSSDLATAPLLRRRHINVPSGLSSDSPGSGAGSPFELLAGVMERQGGPVDAAESGEHGSQAVSEDGGCSPEATNSTWPSEWDSSRSYCRGASVRLNGSNSLLVNTPKAAGKNNNHMPSGGSFPSQLPRTQPQRSGRPEGVQPQQPQHTVHNACEGSGSQNP